MKIKSITIELQPSYSDNAGKYEAEINYETNRRDQVKLVLDPEISTQLLNFLGPVITKMAIKATDDLRANIEQSVIEAQKATKLIEV